MKRGRVMLLTGLPAGVGVSTAGLALADALCAQSRSVLLVAPLAAVGGLLRQGGQVRHVMSATLVECAGGLVVAPLELCVEDQLPQLLPLLAMETDMVLVDRFTGLRVAGNPWQRVADEALLVVDGRPGMDIRSLLLAHHLGRHWPHRPLHLLHTCMGDGHNPDRAPASFRHRLEQRGLQPALDLGCLPEDPSIARASRDGVPFTRMFPNHPASRRLRQAARSLMGYTPALPLDGERRPHLEPHAMLPHMAIQPREDF